MSRPVISWIGLCMAVIFSGIATCYSALAAELQKKGSENQPEFNVKDHFNGTISNLHVRKVENADRLMGTLAGDSGGQAMVDFGQSAQTKKLGLKNGEHVTLSGPLARFADEIMIVADKVEANGKSANIDRKFQDVAGKITAVQYTAFLPGGKGGPAVGGNGHYAPAGCPDQQGRQGHVGRFRSRTSSCGVEFGAGRPGFG